MSDTASLDAIAQALADIRVRFGATGFGDRRRVVSLLADKVPEAKREIRAVGTAIDERVPEALTGSERHLLGMEMDRLAERLEASTGLRLDIARPVVRAFAYAMDLGPLPSVYVTSAPVAPTAPAPSTGWAGLTEPVAPAPQPVVYHPQPQRPTPVPANTDGITIAGRTFPRMHVFGAGAAIAVGVVAMQFMEPAPTPAPPPDNTTSATSASGGPTTTGGTTSSGVPTTSGNTTTGGTSASGGPVASTNFADETTDFGVPAQNGLQANVNSPTPLAIPVGQRITTEALQALLARDKSTLLIDVLDGQHPMTIRGAKFFPIGGSAGSVGDPIQPVVSQTVKALAGNRPNRPIVFFCYGSRCWESYNAVLRADAARLRNLYWYRGGLASWQAAGLPMDPTPAPLGVSSNQEFGL